MDLAEAVKVIHHLADIYVVPQEYANKIGEGILDIRKCQLIKEVGEMIRVLCPHSRYAVQHWEHGALLRVQEQSATMFLAIEPGKEDDMSCWEISHCEIPAPNMTKERAEEFREFVSKLSSGEMMNCCWLSDPDNEENSREEIAGWVEEYIEILQAGGRFDVFFLNMPQSFACSGGMTTGDSPTDACALFEKLTSINALNNKLLDWADEDYLKLKREEYAKPKKA